MFWHGAKLLLILGRPWLLGLAMRAGRAAALGIIGLMQRRRYAERLASADPEQLAELILPFMRRHGFVLERSGCDEQGVLLAGTVAVDRRRQVMLVRAQTAAAPADARVLNALAAAAGADGHALLIGAGEVSEEVRRQAQDSGQSLGVLDGLEFAGEVIASGASGQDS